jgi:hypothetical protein
MSVAALTVPALSARTRITFRRECLRAVSSGTVETAGLTFIALILARHYQASDTIKSIGQINDKVGLLLSPLVITLVTYWRIRAARAASFMMLGSAASFCVAALPNVYAFVWGSVCALTFSAAAIPLVTQIYQDNYPRELRGKLFSRQLIIRILSACLFGALTAQLLDYWPFLFPLITAAYAVAMLLSALALWRIPSSRLTDPGAAARNPFYALRFVVSDKTFRNTLISWMLIGTANLTMQALRGEYLANTDRFKVTLNGAALSTFFIYLLTDIVPNMARLSMSPIWGRFFDRMNFFALRIAINIGFGIAIVTFFIGDTYAGHLIGAAIWGISIAGGDLCWSLWVTKLAPPHQVAHYMSVHTFLTGLRGIAAPFLAFWLVDVLSLPWLAFTVAVMIGLSCLVLLPEVFARRPLSRDVEEQLSD